MALDRPEYWRYFGADEDEAIDAVLERLAERDDAADLEPGAVKRATRKAVAFLEKATGRFFRPRTGELLIDGTGARRLWLPWPLVTEAQDATAVDVEVEIDGDAVDAADFVANAGAAVGYDDPRDDPWIELKRSTGFGAGSFAIFPEEPQIVSVTATWGYVEEDGTTPEPVLDVLARLVSLSLDRPAADAGGAPVASALQSEAVEGRSYAYAAAAASFGLTLDREIDVVLRAYARPPEVIVSRGQSAARRARRLIPSEV